MRKSKNLSMRKAAALIGKSDTFISHLEHERLDIRNNIIQEIVMAYGHNIDEFQIFMEQDESLFIFKKASHFEYFSPAPSKGSKI